MSDAQKLREELGESTHQLALRLRLPQRDIEAWETGQSKVPRLRRRQLERYVELRRRSLSLKDSPLPECKWIAEWKDRSPEDSSAVRQYLKELDVHERHCAVCRMRVRCSEARSSALSPYIHDAWSYLALDWVESLPPFLRPPSYGACLFLFIFGKKLAIALPVLLILAWLGVGVEGLALVPLVFIALATAGALGGFVYALLAPLARRLAAGGAYLTGVACTGASVAFMLLAMAWLEGPEAPRLTEPFVRAIWFIVSLALGLPLGHLLREFWQEKEAAA